MAFGFDSYFNDDKKKQEMQNMARDGYQITGAPPTVGSSEASTSGVQMGAENSPTNNQKSQGTGYINFDRYTKANEGNNFADQFAGKLSNDMETAKQRQKQSADAFSNQVNQSMSKAPTQSQIDNAIADPTKADASEYQKWMTQKYDGPADFSQNQKAWQAYSQGLQEKSRALGSKGGEMALLQNYFGRPRYSDGAKGLDAGLIQANAGDRLNQFTQNVAQNTVDSNRRVNELNALAGVGADQVALGAKNARKAIGLDDQGRVLRGEGSGALGGYLDQLDSYLKGENDKRHQSQQEAMNYYGNQYKNTMDTYGVDPSKYFSSGDDLTLDQAMTDEQRARLRALENLANIENKASDPSKKRQAGNAFNFDEARFNNDIKSQKADFDQKMKSVWDQYFSDPINNPLADWQGRQKANEILEQYGFDPRTGKRKKVG